MQRYNPANPFLPSNFWGFQTQQPQTGYYQPQPQIAPAPVQYPQSGTSPYYGNARLGDATDRRQTFGNCYQQPIFPSMPHYGRGLADANAPIYGDVRVGEYWKHHDQQYLQPSYPIQNLPSNSALGMQTPSYVYANSIQKAM